MYLCGYRGLAQLEIGVSTSRPVGIDGDHCRVKPGPGAHGRWSEDG